MGKILLYYKYIDIDDPAQIAESQKALCTSLGLTGRIIVAPEGINGTVGGSLAAIESYKTALHEHPLFHDITFKESEGDQNHFPRLRVMVKQEIVRLGISPDKLSALQGGTYLSPEQAHKKIAENPDLVIVDTRNDYESRVGAFKGALKPGIKTFREFPEYVDQNIELFKDKEVLMYCTGGVRVERASAYLKEKGIAKEVYQLEGGIHCYLEQFPNGHFRGKNFVFDGRVTLSTNDDILTVCDSCKTSCDEYTHCVYAICNKLMILCKTCKNSSRGTCSEECALIISQGNAPIRTAPYKTGFPL